MDLKSLKLKETIWKFIHSIQQKANEIQIFPRFSKFQIKYRHSSLAIINSF